MNSPDDAALIAAAEQAMARAYAKYSGFRVGAAVLTMRGGLFVGCNVENICYPLGICAERNAIAAAVASEGAGMRLAQLAVVAQMQGTPQVCTPCGACRQVILEFGGNAEVLYRGVGLTLVRTKAKSLLPDAFVFAPPQTQSLRGA